MKIYVLIQVLKLILCGPSANKSALALIIFWPEQVMNYYLNQWWPRSIIPYGIPGPPYAKGLKLTHLSLDKTAAISQKKFSIAFSWMKSFIAEVCS